MSNSPLVSICCITYNQEQYIEQTLNGFIMQKTNFSFEIIIHDDASTDNTKQIIQRFKNEYPEKIVTIFQKVNQFSKKEGGIFSRFVFPLVKGEYIALCEGDDYWTNPYKLQMQIDEMKRHPKCDMCFHPAKVKRNTVNYIKWNYSNKLEIFYIDDILSSAGQFAPTASYLIKSKIIKNLPDWFKTAPVADFFLEIFGALSGGILFIPNCMSVYRINHKGSWSDITFNQVTNIRVFEQYEKMKEYLQYLADYLPKKYKKDIDKKKSAIFYGQSLYYLANKNYKMFKDHIEKSFGLYRKFSPFAKVLFNIRHFGEIARLIYIYKLKFYNAWKS